MIKYLITLLGSVFVCAATMAEPADSSYSIQSSKDVYEFVFNKKLNRVEIHNNTTVNYITNNYQVAIPVVEMYNDHITITDIKAKAEGKKPWPFEPQYSYYSVNNVFYSDAKVCYFNLVVAKKGGTATASFSKVIDDPRYFTSIYFPENVKVAQKEVKIIIPRWMVAEIKELNSALPNIKKTTVYDRDLNADIITYTATALPAMESEDNSPGPTYIYPHLLVLNKTANINNQPVKYFATTADQYAWYHNLVKDVTNDDQAIAAKARELTSGINNDIDKVKAIFYYIQHNIRYIAFEDGIAGFKPEKAQEVLRRNYGDCKGMANLTKAMLTALGFDARLCWLGTKHIAYNYQTPSIAVDNHMICALMHKGKTYYLDATETYLGINEYAERIQGRQVLMENGESYTLNTIPATSAQQNTDREVCKLNFEGNALLGTVARTWTGEEKEYLLSGINSVKRERADDILKLYLAKGKSDYLISDLKNSGTDDIDNNFTISYNINNKNGVSNFNTDYYVDLDYGKELINSSIEIAKRKHAYWFSHKMNVEKETELTIPGNYKITVLPAPLNIVNNDYEFHIKYTQAPGKLIYKKQIIIKNTQLSQSGFRQWNADIEQLARTYNETVTLKLISQ